MTRIEELDIIATDRFAYIAEQASNGQTDQVKVVTDYNHQLFALARDSATRDIAAMPWLPQLAETWAQEIYEEVAHNERQYIAPNLQSAEYEMGTATQPDDIAVVDNGLEPYYMFTAEHATPPVRFKTGKREDPDTGTAGHAVALAKRHGKAFIMIGDQQGNVAIDPDHKFKKRVQPHIAGMSGFLSLHACSPGLFFDFDDRTEAHAILGLGADPTDELHDFALDITKVAKDELGLRVVVGNDGHEHYVQKKFSTEIKTNEDGTPYRNRLAALKPTTMPNFVRLHMGSDFKPTMQIEMSPFLRVTPLDTNVRTENTRIIGVALGFKLLERIVDLTYANGRGYI